MAWTPRQNPDALIAEISAAFNGVRRGDGTTLHEAEAIDCGLPRREQMVERQVDTDKSWDQIPDEWIESLSSAPYFLNAEGLRYYLPAAMIWAIRHTEQSDSSSGDNIESILFLPQTARELHPMLTDQQRRAVARWLEWQAECSFAAEAARKRLQTSIWGAWLG